MSARAGAAETSYIYLTDIASGGMGRVQLVMRKERQFERFYARKRIHPALARDQAFVDMFFDEARIAGHLRHAHIVCVLDVGEDADGPFMVMDYVDGLSLSDIFERYQERIALLPIQVCLRIVQDVARGLHAAHEARNSSGESLGIIHRDVSPSNVLIGFDGIVRISDFGVAKAWGRVNETNTGGVKGKFAYMSPEQIQAGQLDRRTDLFSLGILLGEALTGTRFYDGPLGPSRIVAEPPPELEASRDDVPDDVAELYLHLMAKDPALRPRTAKEIVQRIEPILARLAAEEEPLTLADFLEQHFALEREQRAAWLVRAVEGASSVAGEDHKRTELEDAKTEPHPENSAASSEASAVVTVAHRTASHASAPEGGRWVIAAVGMATVAALLTSIALWEDSPELVPMEHAPRRNEVPQKAAPPVHSEARVESEPAIGQHLPPTVEPSPEPIPRIVTPAPRERAPTPTTTSQREESLAPPVAAEATPPRYDLHYGRREP